MTRNLLILILLCGKCGVLYGQNTHLDSLKIVLTQLNRQTAGYSLDTQRVNILLELVSAYHKLALPDSMELYTRKAIHLSENNKFEKGLAKGYRMLGASFKFRDKLYDATDYFFKALYLAESQKDIHLQGVIFWELGSCYSLLKQYGLSEKYFRRAIPFFKKTNDTRRAGLTIHNIGNLYFYQNQYQKASSFYRQSASLFIEANSLGDVGHSYEAIGSIHEKFNHLDSAQIYLAKAQKYFEQYSTNTYIKLHIKNELARVYLKKRDFENSILLGKEVLPQSNKLNFNLLSYKIAENLYQAYTALSETKQALFYHEQMAKYKEKVTEEDIQKRSQSLKYEYDSQKQKEINVLQNQEIEAQERAKNYLKIGLILFIVFTASMFYINRLLRKKNIQIEKQQSEIIITQLQLEDLNNGLEIKVTQRTSELTKANEELVRKNREIAEALLKGQTIERKRVATELHDNLGGQISAIRWSMMALDNRNLSPKELKLYESIMGMMNRAYDEIRYISHHLLPEEFEKQGLIAALQKLVNELNFNAQTHFELQIINYQPVNQKIEFEIYSVVMELINNILKHANATKATIKIAKEPTMLTVSIWDNGIGVSQEKIQNGGMGFKNIKERIQAAGGTFSIETNLNSQKKTNISLIFDFD